MMEIPTNLPLPSFTTDDARWAAVQSRDLLADGQFVYCVRTTKIYCRPVCKARLARRDNVLFHLSPREAKAAGYRACKRCKPDEGGVMPDEVATRKIQEYLFGGASGGDTPNSVGSEDVTDATDDGNMEVPASTEKMTINTRRRKAETLEEMSKKAGISKWHFHRKFKELTGLTPKQYAKVLGNLPEGLSDGLPGMSTGGSQDFILDGLSGTEPITTATSDFQQDADANVDVDVDWTSFQGYLTPNTTWSAGPTVNEVDWKGWDAMGDEILKDVSRPVVFYAMRPLSAGFLLVIFQDHKTRLVQRGDSQQELMAVLAATCAATDFDHRDIDDVSQETDLALQARVDKVVKLFENDV